jgi:hypothetical protein
MMKVVKYTSHHVPGPIVLMHTCLIAAFSLQLLLVYPTFG